MYMSIKSLIFSLVNVLIFIFFLQSVHAASRNDSIGISLGMNFPENYETNFPIKTGEDEYPIIDDLVESLFYKRRISDAVSFSASLSFLGLKEKKDNLETLYVVYPLSSTLYYKARVMSGISVGVGAGLDYWVYEEKKQDSDTYNAKSGAHLSFLLYYVDFHAELMFSKIDNFKNTDHDFGGWRFSIGIAHQMYIF